MRSKKQLLKNWKLYVILDAGLFSDRRLLRNKFYELAESPIDALQIRCKAEIDFSLFLMIKKMASFLKKKKIFFIINDKPELVSCFGADGVHLGKGDIPVRLARKIAGKDAVIGSTIRNACDIREVQKQGADYAAIGPVFSTPLKPELKQVTPKILKETIRAANLPLVAIGGINTSNVREISRFGVKTVAFARYAVTEKNTEYRIKLIKQILDTEIK
ncbi:MAG: thiamine phosphate synthase [Candidatus Omnitrophota bacterium]